MGDTNLCRIYKNHESFLPTLKLYAQCRPNIEKVNLKTVYQILKLQISMNIYSCIFIAYLNFYEFDYFINQNSYKTAFLTITTCW